MTEEKLKIFIGNLDMRKNEEIKYDTLAFDSIVAFV